MMSNERQMLQLLRTHVVGLCEVADVNHVGFKKLIHRSIGLALVTERQDHSFVEFGYHMRNEPERAQSQIDVAEYRLILVQRDKGHFGL